MTGAAMEGTWFDRTLEYDARLRGQGVRQGGVGDHEVVRLSPLPCWKHLPEKAYRAPGNRAKAAGNSGSFGLQPPRPLSNLPYSRAVVSWRLFV